jgi:hypothetical protein
MTHCCTLDACLGKAVCRMMQACLAVLASPQQRISLLFTRCYFKRPS